MHNDNLSDTQIRSNLRNVLAKHSIDMNETQFVCAKGIVRMMGELKQQGTQSATPISSYQLDALEQDIGNAKGVKRVHYDLKNYRRMESGQWKLINHMRPPSAPTPPASGNASEYP